MAHYDILDRVLGSKPAVQMPFVEEAGVATQISEPHPKKRLGVSRCTITPPSSAAGKIC